MFAPTPDPRPLLAITQGDPAGVGPEVVLKALARHPDLYDRCRPLVVGDRRILQRAAPWVGTEALPLLPVSQPADGVFRPGAVDLVDLGNADPADCPTGVESAAAGRAAVEAVFAACDLTLSGAADAVVTAPLNKAAMHMAGFTYAGHTELLAERTAPPRSACSWSGQR
jgi:4-hydroxythreonine-4-phosphate dehydrogenase